MSEHGLVNQTRKGAVLVGVDLYRDYDRKKRPRRRARTEAIEPPALGGVTIELRRGTILGLVGESGSGKSTLARCLTLLERPDRGQVFLNGEELTALSERELRRRRRFVQTIFQDPYSSLNPRLSVSSCLQEVLKVHGISDRAERKRRVRELLDMVGLPTAALDRTPADFSGGQRQRIGIARALAVSPQVLVADEAVSALDVSIQAQILNLFLGLKSELDLSMIFISHDMNVVRYVADEVAVMFGGQLVERMSDRNALDRPEHPYTQRLAAATPSLRSISAHRQMADSGLRGKEDSKCAPPSTTPYPC